MDDCFLGPMPPDEFLNAFMSVPGEIPPISFQIDFPEATTEQFLSNITAKAREMLGSEAELIPLATRNEELSGIAPCSGLHPDFIVASRESSIAGDTKLHSLQRIDVWGYTKATHEHDPFDDNPSEPLWAHSVSGVMTRYELCAIHSLISQSQFRVRIFSLYLEEKHCMCRFLCWTASGVIVSSRFAFNTSDSPLGQFFKRLSLMSRGKRGWDRSIKPASQEEASLAAAAFSVPREERCVYEDDCDPTQPIQPPTPLENVNPNEFISIGVPLDEAWEPGVRQTFRRVVARRPGSSLPRGLIGPRTLCLEVYDLTTNRVLMMKDSWRISGATMERTRLKTLNAAKVCNVSTLLFGGDIKSHRGGEPSNWVESVWNKNPEPEEFRLRRHQRFVTLEVGDPLHQYTCSRDAVLAVRACIQGHGEAYMKCGLIHRDVSIGNALMVHRKNREGEVYRSGLLIDWELSIPVSMVKDVPNAGTWPFLSIKLSMLDSDQSLAASDDLESFYWVLLYLFVRYGGFKPGKCGSDAKLILRDVFHLRPVNPKLHSGKVELITTFSNLPLGYNFRFAGGPSLSKWMADRLEDLRLFYFSFPGIKNRPSGYAQCGPQLQPIGRHGVVFGLHSRLLASIDELVKASGWPEVADPARDVGIGEDGKLCAFLRPSEGLLETPPPPPVLWVRKGGWRKTWLL